LSLLEKSQGRNQPEDTVSTYIDLGTAIPSPVRLALSRSGGPSDTTRPASRMATAFPLRDPGLAVGGT
jgi:hypothetical protein